MGVKNLVSEEEYLQMSFDGPEPDYVDGEVLDRAMPNNEHSKAILKLLLVLARAALAAPLFIRPELRIQVGPKRFRVVDIVVYAGQEPLADVPTETPFATIEVLSPTDRFSELISKLADYQELGVPHIWLADPETRRLSVYRDGSLTVVQEFAAPEFQLAITGAEVFAQ